MSDAYSQDDTLSNGPGREPAGVVVILLLAAYLLVVGSLCSLKIWLMWPSCGEIGASHASDISSKDAKAADVQPKANAAAADPSSKDAKAADAKLKANAAAAPEGNVALQIAQVDPITGPVKGETRVTILGSGFTEDVVVLFGGYRIEKSFVDSGTLSFHTPPHALGKVNLTVFDKQRATLTGAFTYVCPGPSSGDLMIMVVLAGTLGGALHAIWSFVLYVGNRQLKRSWILFYVLLPVKGAFIALVFYLVVQAGFYSPQGGTDSKDLILVGLAALVGLFSPQSMEKLRQIADTVLTKSPTAADAAKPPGAPGVSSIEPTGGSVAGNTDVVIRGTGFTGARSVRFGTQQAVLMLVRGDGVIAARSPAQAASTVDVTVEFPDGRTLVLPQGYTYQNLQLTKVAPASGQRAGGEAVKITGHGFFARVRSIQFGANSGVLPTIATPTQIDVLTPPAAGAGAVNVVVTLEDGQTQQLAAGFTYN